MDTQTVFTRLANGGNWSCNMPNERRRSSKDRAATMKVHMVKVSSGVFGGGLKRGSLCGRLNNASRDGMNISLKPDEVTCGFCLRFDLKKAATQARKTEREFNLGPR
jgi:hypothetical protein